MKISKFNRRFRRGVAATLGALCCSSTISEAKVDIDLQKIMDDFKLSKTDPNKFKEIIKQKADNLLKSGIIEIDPSFEKVDDESKFIIISALEKLSEIPLVKKALTHDNTKVKLVGIGIFDLESPAMYNYGYNAMSFVDNYYEREKDNVSSSKTQDDEKKFIDKIDAGKIVNYQLEKVESHVSNRLLYGMKNLTTEETKILAALNTVIHEVGHAVATYSMFELINSENIKQKCQNLIKATKTTPLIKGEYYTGDDFYPRVEELFKDYRKGKKGPYDDEIFSITSWLGGNHYYKNKGDKEDYISKRGNDSNHEYLAELFVHLCGFNLPISQHAKRYADILKVIHGEDCLGDNVKYQ